jgi:hypothetical protein
VRPHLPASIPLAPTLSAVPHELGKQQQVLLRRNKGEINMTTIETIALNKLMYSKDNVRKTNPGEGIAELAASIAAHGLRQNLNVQATASGRFEVVAGGVSIGSEY